MTNRDNQPAVAGLLGWPIVTIKINPQSRGCLAGPWFAMRDKDIVCSERGKKRISIGKIKNKKCCCKKTKGWQVVQIRLACCKNSAGRLQIMSQRV